MIYNPAAYEYGQSLHDGAPDFRLLSETQHISRKERVCRYCKRPIPAGTPYWRAAFLEDGEFKSTVAHSPTSQLCPPTPEEIAELEEQYRKDAELWGGL